MNELEAYRIMGKSEERNRCRNIIVRRISRVMTNNSSSYGTQLCTELDAVLKLIDPPDEQVPATEAPSVPASKAAGSPDFGDAIATELVRLRQEGFR